MEFEIEEDAEPARDELLDQRGTGAREKLAPDFHSAARRVEPRREFQRRLRIGEVECDDDAGISHAFASRRAAWIALS
jgi:hypothetical protein